MWCGCGGCVVVRGRVGQVEGDAGVAALGDVEQVVGDAVRGGEAQELAEGAVDVLGVQVLVVEQEGHVVCGQGLCVCGKWKVETNGLMLIN